MSADEKAKRLHIQSTIMDFKYKRCWNITGIMYSRLSSFHVSRGTFDNLYIAQLYPFIKPILEYTGSSVSVSSQYHDIKYSRTPTIPSSEKKFEHYENKERRLIHSVFLSLTSAITEDLPEKKPSL